MQERLTGALKEAMKARDAARVSVLRMVQAAIKDREIAARSEGGADSGAAALGAGEILALLGKMVKQRHDSARAFDAGGRADLAQKELAEVAVIEEFLPRALTQDEVAAAIGAAIAATGATGLRDMGRVMAELKAAYAGQMDFAAAGALVKARLG